MNRVTKLAALLMILGAPALLEAQAPPAEGDAQEVEGADGTDGTDGADGEYGPVEEPPPPATEPPPPPPPPPVPPPVVVAPEEDEGGVEWLPSTRPGASFGLGLGWSFPGPDLWTPNTLAARFRLASGITIEPSLIIRATGSNDDIDFTDDPRTLFLSLGTMLRAPVASAGPIDFLILGTLGIASSIDLEPGDQHSLSTSLGYGLGLELWLAKRFTVGMDATNPLVQVDWTSTDDGLGSRRKETSWSVGVVWNPQIRFLATLYF